MEGKIIDNDFYNSKLSINGEILGQKCSSCKWYGWNNIEHWYECAIKGCYDYDKYKIYILGEEF